MKKYQKPSIDLLEINVNEIITSLSLQDNPMGYDSEDELVIGEFYFER